MLNQDTTKDTIGQPADDRSGQRSDACRARPAINGSQLPEERAFAHIREDHVGAARRGEPDAHDSAGYEVDIGATVLELQNRRSRLNPSPATLLVEAADFLLLQTPEELEAR